MKPFKDLLLVGFQTCYMKQLSAYFITSIVFLCCSFLYSCNHKRLEMQVKYTTDGCFGSEDSKLIIYSMQDSSIAILETKGQKTKQVTLCEGQRPAAAAFLYEFKRVPDKDCFSTTEENYTITYFDGSGYKTLTKKYNCLKWDGFERLKNVLFNFKK